MKYRVGIDLGATTIKGGLIGEDYRILATKNAKTNIKRPPEEILRDMCLVAASLIDESKINIEDVVGVGVGSPGTVDAEKGIVVYSNNFGWTEIALADYMGRILSLPVKVSNDANCAALGEVKAGAARSCQNAILISLGTGIGGGIILNGHIFEGSHPGGAEIGHTILVAGGEPCTCGRKGCLEAYASATALIRDTKKAAINNVRSSIWKYCHGNPDLIDGRTAFLAMDQDQDNTATFVVEQYISYLADGIVDMVNIFRPDKVLISGGVCNEGEKLTVPLEKYVKERCFAGAMSYIPAVEIAQLGDKAGIIGAAALFE